MKNKVDVSKVVLEGLIGIALTLVVEGITAKIRDRKKKESPEETLVADLTVAELRNILREEA